MPLRPDLHIAIGHGAPAGRASDVDLVADGPPELDVETVLAYRRQADRALAYGTPSERKQVLCTWVEELRLEPERLEVEIAYRVPTDFMNGVVAGAGFEPATSGL